MGGCDDSGCKVVLICCLDEWGEVDICYLVVGLAFPIVHVPCVDASAHEEVDNVHEQLLGRVGDLGNNCNFLAVDATFE